VVLKKKRKKTKRAYLAAAADSSGGASAVRGSEPRGRRSGRRLGSVGDPGRREVVESRAGHERLKARRRELNKRKKEKPTPAGGGQTPLSAAGRREERSRGVARVGDA